MSFTLGSIINSITSANYKSLLVAAATSITLGQFFLFSFLILMFLAINISGYANYVLFKRKRKRLFYLDKINEHGQYQGAM